jgi:hypothetical protein
MKVTSTCKADILAFADILSFVQQEPILILNCYSKQVSLPILVFTTDRGEKLDRDCPSGPCHISPTTFEIMLKDKAVLDKDQGLY